MNALNYAIIVLPGLTMIPILFFLFQTWKFRNQNGLIQIMRRFTIWWVIPFLFHLSAALYINILALLDKPLVTLSNLWILFFTYFGMFCMTVYGAVLFYVLSKK